jgi:hypothetical protein
MGTGLLGRDRRIGDDLQTRAEPFQTQSARPQWRPGSFRCDIDVFSQPTASTAPSATTDSPERRCKDLPCSGSCGGR